MMLHNIDGIKYANKKKIKRGSNPLSFIIYYPNTDLNEI